MHMGNSPILAHAPRQLFAHITLAAHTNNWPVIPLAAHAGNLPVIAFTVHGKCHEASHIRLPPMFLTDCCIASCCATALRHLSLPHASGLAPPPLRLCRPVFTNLTLIASCCTLCRLIVASPHKGARSRYCCRRESTRAVPRSLVCLSSSCSMKMGAPGVPQSQVCHLFGIAMIGMMLMFWVLTRSQSS